MSAGRKSYLTPRVASAIINGMAAGNFQKTIAAYVGINMSTMVYWHQRGEREIARVGLEVDDVETIISDASVKQESDGTFTMRTPGEMFQHRPDCFDEKEWTYAAYTFLFDRARAQAEIRAIGVIQTAMTDDWKAAGWFLERTRPEQYGRRDKVSVGGDADAPAIGIEHTVTVDELETKLAELMGKRAIESAEDDD